MTDTEAEEADAEVEEADTGVEEADTGVEEVDAEVEEAVAQSDHTLRSVSEWRDRKFPRTATGRMHRDAWKHGATEALHGWRKYAHDAAAELQLSEQDYDAAIDAACKQGPSGHYEPHQPAVGRVGRH